MIEQTLKGIIYSLNKTSIFNFSSILQAFYVCSSSNSSSASLSQNFTFSKEYTASVGKKFTSRKQYTDGKKTALKLTASNRLRFILAVCICLHQHHVSAYVVVGVLFRGVFILTESLQRI